MQKFRGAVFLDRDGTVIDEKHYLSDPDQVALIPGAGKAIAELNRAHVAAILVTNQSGVARGYFDEARVHAVHRRLTDLLAIEGAVLDGLFYCPHLEGGIVEPYRRACRCRKPGPGMVEDALRVLPVSGLPHFVVGDKAVDLDLARAVNAAAVLVRTGYGAELARDMGKLKTPPDNVADDLSDAVSWILGRVKVAEGDMTPGCTESGS